MTTCVPQLTSWVGTEPVGAGADRRHRPAARRRLRLRRGRGGPAGRRAGHPGRARGDGRTALRRRAVGAHPGLGGVLRLAGRGSIRACSCPGSAGRCWCTSGRALSPPARRRRSVLRIGAIGAAIAAAGARHRAARRRSRSGRRGVRSAQLSARRSTRVTCSRRCRRRCADASTWWSPTSPTSRPTRSRRCRRRHATTRRAHRPRRGAGRARRARRVAVGAAAWLAARRPPADRDEPGAGGGRGGRVRAAPGSPLR